MKRKYEAPKAEIVVFDYTETVVACTNIGWCGWCFYNPPKCTQPQGTGTQEEKKPTAPINNPYFAPGWGQHCS